MLTGKHSIAESLWALREPAGRVLCGLGCLEFWRSSPGLGRDDQSIAGRAGILLVGIGGLEAKAKEQMS